MTSPRLQAYHELLEAIKNVSDQDELNVTTRRAMSDAEYDLLVPEFKQVVNALTKLDALMPLERDVENNVQETLVVERTFFNHWTSSSERLRVVNSLGARETVQDWHADIAYASEIEQWSHCRETSEVEDTPWDEARKERLVDLKFVRKAAIDRGLNFAYDLIQRAECEYLGGSEGHPGYAFIHVDGYGMAFDALTDEFQRLGWSVHFDEEMPQFATIRMPKVDTVEARDAEWRKLSRDFNYDLLAQTRLTPR